MSSVEYVQNSMQHRTSRTSRGNFQSESFIAKASWRKFSESSVKVQHLLKPFSFKFTTKWPPVVKWFVHQKSVWQWTFKVQLRTEVLCRNLVIESPVRFLLNKTAGSFKQIECPEDRGMRHMGTQETEERSWSKSLGKSWSESWSKERNHFWRTKWSWKSMPMSSFSATNWACTGQMDGVFCSEHWLTLMYTRGVHCE